MCQERHQFNQNILLAVGLFAGLAVGFSGNAPLIAAADNISHVFISLLKLISLPIIFLSIVSTATGMSNIRELKLMGRLVGQYTVATTVIAALVALGAFLIVNPVHADATAGEVVNLGNASYLTYLLNVIPSNAVQPFLENNVIGVLLLAILLSLATISLPEENRAVLHTFFKSLFMAVMKITSWIVKLMPLAIFAFIALFIRDMQQGLEVKSVAKYLLVVLAANLIQAGIVLPMLLKAKGLSPLKTFKAMAPALSLAFFSKSSSAALPLAISCAQNNLKLSPRVAGFSLPLCTTINMNACAAFILSTVLFVCMSSGMQFSYAELFGWVFVSTIAAIGNAGVPMGCFFLSSAILASMNVPLNLLGVILPFYSLIDMLESAINVWSDSCVTAVVDQDVERREAKEAVGSTVLG